MSASNLLGTGRLYFNVYFQSQSIEWRQKWSTVYSLHWQAKTQFQVILIGVIVTNTFWNRILRNSLDDINWNYGQTMNSDPGGSMSRKSAEWKDFEYIRRANLPLSTTTTSRKIIRQIKKSSQRPFSMEIWTKWMLCLCIYDAKCYCCFQYWIKLDLNVWFTAAIILYVHM